MKKRSFDQFGYLAVAGLLCGFGTDVRAEAAKVASRRLSIGDAELEIPKASKLTIQSINRRDLLVNCAGQIVIRGEYSLDCVGVCKKTTKPNARRLSIRPDRASLARLPYWLGMAQPASIEIVDTSQSWLVAMRGGPASIQGRGDFVIDRLKMGIACDASWASARIVSFRRVQVAPVTLMGSGC